MHSRGLDEADAIAPPTVDMSRLAQGIEAGFIHRQQERCVRYQMVFSVVRLRSDTALQETRAGSFHGVKRAAACLP